MKISICLKGNLLAGFLFLSPFLSDAQTWEVYDRNFQLTSRIEYDQISILGESVRISSVNNTLKLLSKEYKPFLNLKGESVYQYLEPWIITKGPNGMGAFHEYGEEIFAPEYDKIETFYTQLLAQKGKTFLVYDRMTKKINSLGNFESAFLAQNGQIIAKKEEGYFLPMSKTPNHVYENIKEVNENFLISHERTGYGLINRNGDYILDPIIDQLSHMKEDYFYAFDGKQYMLIKAREERADIKYVSFHKITWEDDILLEYIHGKLRRVMKDDGILLDYTGMESVFKVGQDHYNIILKDKKTGLLGPKGWEVNPLSDIEYIFPGNENTFGIRKEGKYGFINKSGQLIVQNKFDTVSKFSEGLAAVKKEGSWGYIDKTDRIIIPNQFDEASDFHNGLAIVKKNGKSNLIDQNGRLVLDNPYSGIFLTTDNYFISVENHLFGLIDPLGNEIVEPKFDELRRESANKILVRMDSKFGVMDEGGNYSLPIYYKNILFDQGTDLILAEDYYQFKIIPKAPLENNTKKKGGE